LHEKAAKHTCDPKDDRGAIAVMDQVIRTPWEKVVMRALPRGVKIKTLEHREI